MNPSLLLDFSSGLKWRVEGVSLYKHRYPETGNKWMVIQKSRGSVTSITSSIMAAGFKQNLFHA